MAKLQTDGSEPEVAYEATISMVTANVIALALLPVLLAVFLLPFRWLWEKPLINWQELSSLAALAVILPAFLVGVAVHELLHAAGFVWAGKAPISTVKFGILWRALAPYAHCRAPITAAAYRISLALPGILLGLVPGLLGLAIGAGWLLMWGVMMSVAAAGDLAVLLAIRAVSGDSLVLDHPSKAGCLVLKEGHGRPDSA